MCGIAGYIGRRIINEQTCACCLAAMRHRGPHGSGVHRHVLANGRFVSLLHTRLAIIDLNDRALQPMRYGHHVMTYNGELYDYPEIRAREGWDDLRTESDSEVMLRLLIDRGWPALADAEAMFALALLDEREETLLLARDRFGEKPLFLLRRPDGLYFGSEIKFIRALCGEPLAIDENQVRRYLVNGYRALYKQPRGGSFFRDIEELAPGTVLRIDADGREHAHRYWTFTTERDDALTFEEAARRVRDAVCRAVEVRLRADVPIAFLMSGGVDSNTMISVARRVFDHDVHGFTIMNEDGRYDERDVVHEAVRELGVRHQEIELDTGDFLGRLRQLVVAHDAPVCTISYYAHWLLVSAVAEHGYRIVISGTGADELFTGYYDHHNAYLHSVSDDADALAVAQANWDRWVKPVVRNPWLSRRDLLIEDPACRDFYFLDAPTFSSWLVEPWEEPFEEAEYAESLLRNRMLNQLLHETVPPMLHDDDHNSMSVSIENRTPFLDRGIFEAAAAIPDALLMRDGYAKAVLRESMRGIVPDRVLDERRKVGFNAPIFSLLDHRSDAVRDEMLAPGPVYDIVRRDAVEAILMQDDLPNSRSKFLFSVLSARAFLDAFA